MKKISFAIAVLFVLGIAVGCSSDAGVVQEGSAGTTFEGKGGKKGAVDNDNGLTAPSSSPTQNSGKG